VEVIEVLTGLLGESRIIIISFLSLEVVPEDDIQVIQDFSDRGPAVKARAAHARCDMALGLASCAAEHIIDPSLFGIPPVRIGFKLAFQKNTPSGVSWGLPVI
jgi:hypothetical protein